VMPRLPAPLKAQLAIHSTRNVFVSIPVFQDCEPHEIMSMIQGLVSHLALPSDVLIQIGSMGRGLFFIMRGTVNIKLKQPKLTSAQLAEIKFKFDAMDVNASGSIDFKELRAAIRSLGYNFRSSDLRKLMDGIDSDGSGLIEFPEFCEMLLKNKEFLAAVYPDALADFDDGVDQSDGFSARSQPSRNVPRRSKCRLSRTATSLFFRWTCSTRSSRRMRRCALSLKNTPSECTGRACCAPGLSSTAWLPRGSDWQGASAKRQAPPSSLAGVLPHHRVAEPTLSSRLDR